MKVSELCVVLMFVLLAPHLPAKVAFAAAVWFAIGSVVTMVLGK